MRHYEIYTDGSYSAKYKPGETHGSVVYWNKDENKWDKVMHIKTSDKNIVSGNNVGGECLAAWFGVLSKVSDLIEEGVAGTDEEILIEVISDYEGVTKWITYEWANANRPSAKWYRLHVESLLSYIKEDYPNITVKFTWVKGHADTAGNEVADAVACWDESGVNVYGADVYIYVNDEVVSENG